MVVVSKWDAALLLLAEQHYKDALRCDHESSFSHLIFSLQILFSLWCVVLSGT